MTSLLAQLTVLSAGRRRGRGQVSLGAPRSEESVGPRAPGEESGYARLFPSDLWLAACPGSETSLATCVDVRLLQRR